MLFLVQFNIYSIKQTNKKIVNVFTLLFLFLFISNTISILLLSFNLDLNYFLDYCQNYIRI